MIKIQFFLYKYIFRFIGCVAVTTSMKALTFDTRSAIAKECINRVRLID